MSTFYPPAPTLYADFRTGQYLFNGTRFANFSAWLTALGGTYTRASTATYTNSSGFLVPNGAGSGVIRFDYNPLTLSPNGILCEGASTNLHTDSSISSNVPNYNTQSGGTLTANAAVAPDGTATAAVFVPGTTNGQHDFFLSAGVNIVATKYTFSVFAKPNGFTNFQLDADNGGHFAQFTLSGAGSVSNVQAGCSASIVLVANGWYRCSVTFTSGGIANVNALLYTLGNGTSRTYTGDGVSGYFFWGFQYEALGFASSYIPTTNATASRAADSISTPTTWYNNSAGTLYALADTENGASNQDAVITGIETQISGANALTLLAGTAATAALADMWSGGNEVITHFEDSLLGQTAYTVNTLSAAAISATIAGALYCKDGRTVATSTVSAMPVSPDTFFIGGDNPGLFNASVNGHVAAIGYWPIVFSASDLQNLTGSNIAFDIGLVNLTNKAGRYFSRRDYAEWLDKIAGEFAAEEEEYQSFIRAAEYERNLTPVQRADRDFDDAERELGESEEALFRNLTDTNHIKFSEAKEKRDRARKDRDHHYYMDVVKKAWDEYNKK